MQATSISASDLGVVNNLYAFILQVKIWPGRTKLTKEDFPEVELPPEEIASLGSKKLCDPEKLRPFGKLKARAEELLDNRGVRFLKGWAVPESIAEDTAEQLDAIMEEFDVEKEVFLTNYNGIIRDWINQHPAWSTVIANSSVSESHVRARLGFKWQAFEVAMPQRENDSSSVLNRGLHEEVTGLGNTLYAEIARAADEAWKRCYQGKSKISHKALSPLRTIHNKLVALSFVEPHIAPVADLIKTAMDNVPKKGWISGAPLIALQGMVSMLRDPDALIEHARLVMADTDPMSVLESIAGGVATDDADDSPADVAEDVSSVSETDATAAAEAKKPERKPVQASLGVPNLGLF